MNDEARNTAYLLDELERSVYWAVLTKTLRDKQTAIKDRLLNVNCEDAVQIAKLQAENKAYDIVLNLPMTHRREAREE